MRVCDTTNCNPYADFSSAWDEAVGSGPKLLAQFLTFSTGSHPAFAGVSDIDGIA